MNTLSLPTISEILVQNLSEPLLCSSTEEPFADLKAQREWFSAVQTVNQLLEQISQSSPETIDLEGCDRTSSKGKPSRPRWSILNQLPPPISSETAPCQGIVLSGPSAILMRPALGFNFATQIFTPQTLTQTGHQLQTRHTLPLPSASNQILAPLPPTGTVSLPDEDPLTQEPFCVVLTPQFSLTMALGVDETGTTKFLFSFDPEVVNLTLRVLRQRLQDIHRKTPSMEVTVVAEPLALFERFVEQFTPVAPHYTTVAQFSRLMLQNLPLEVKTVPEKVKAKASPQSHAIEKAIPAVQVNPTPQTAEVELLQAIAHEVRTPLATIRTLTRLLLKRRQFDPDVVRKRLEMIDQECTTQIDRFNLIFRAVELEASQQQAISKCGQKSPAPVQLTTLCLGDVLRSSVPRWQKQAHQRNHTLNVNIPPTLPTVVSDPTMLDQVLTGLIENFSRSLPCGSHIQVGVCLAGNQLKLKLESQADDSSSEKNVTPKSPLKSIGPLLMFQPETGSLSLNLSVTKNLFQALGGKLVVRQRPQQGKVMTIFLPLKN